MLSSTGKKIRLGRILDPATGRGIVIAYSHSLILGPQPGMETVDDISGTLDACQAANAIMVPPGFVDRFAEGFVGPGRPSLVVHLDWTSFSRSVLPHDLGGQTPVASIESVAAAGGEAVMTYLLLGYDDSERDAAEIRRNAEIARECDRLGLVHVIEPRYAQERRYPERKTDPAIMHYYCRVSSDLGADIVKCVWPGSAEAMARIVERCPAPVLVAGGAYDAATPERSFDLARQAVSAGARGLVIGRNVYQSDDPRATLLRLQQIVQA